MPEALDLVDSEPTQVLVLEHVPGLSLGAVLQSGALSSADFLTIAIQLAEVVGRIHAQRLIHRDIHPGNILIDPTTLHAHLIDFGLTRPLGTTSGELVLSGSGTYHYISPEQTGRMGRGVDPRSDLYSLGATLYFALTGRPPFEGADALALIHAHLAKLPLPAIVLRPALPSTFSRIVAKLLQKAPEDRYQTAHALHRDLCECRDQLRRNGAVDSEFPLASADVPYRPLFSKRIYGREPELRVVRDALASAAQGTPTVLVLRGVPGIGKSALIQELRMPLAGLGGYLAHGKFDLYRRDLPYAGFIQALGSFAEQILAESDARLAHWRECLTRATGAIARVIADLVPDLGLVLGDVSPVPTLGPAETRARLALAVQRLVRAAATREHPLVLFFDDLQWSDAGSRALLEELLLEPQPCALLVLLTYRDTEVSPGHPVAKLLDTLRASGTQLHEVALAPLGEDACAQMLADALGHTPERTRSLAACVARKTGNAPLLIQQFVTHMYDIGLIHFEADAGWTWDDQRLLGVDIPDDAVALMTCKIERLAPAVASVLELASCAGDTFHLEMLSELTDRPRSELESALFALCDEGLIVPVAAGFRFAHDRIREAAQSLLSGEERLRLHREAARWLLERVHEKQLPERSFEIADHLALVTDRLDEGERLPAVQLLQLAGQRALASGAPDTARRYLDLARPLFRADDWAARAAVGFDLFLRSAESAFQLADHDATLQLLDVLDAQALTRVQSAMVAALRIRAYTFRDGGPSAYARIPEIYRRFGLPAPVRPSWLLTRLIVAYMDWTLRGPLDESTFRPATGLAEDMIVRGLLATASAHAYTLASIRVSAIGAGMGCVLFRKHGYHVALDIALAGYAACRSAFLRDLAGADRYAEAALAWSSRWPQTAHKVDHIAFAAVYAWTRPRKSVLEPLRRVAEIGREQGDASFVVYALLCRAMYAGLCGEPLDAVRENFQLLERQYVAHGDSVARPYLAAIALLTDGQSEKNLQHSIAAIDARVADARSSKMSAWALWLQVLCMLGQHQAVHARASAAWSWAFEIGSMLSQLADYLFFWGISASELATGAPLRERLRYRRVLQRCLRQLRIWARHGPDFVHMVEALEAERARLRGDVQGALARYAQISDAAAQRGYVHHAALLQERRARLLSQLRRDFEARGVLQRAAALYGEWGARAKAEELRRLAASNV